MGAAGYVTVDGAAPDVVLQLLHAIVGGDVDAQRLTGDGWQLDVGPATFHDTLVGIVAAPTQLHALTDRVFDELCARTRWNITADADPDSVYVERARSLRSDPHGMTGASLDQP